METLPQTFGSLVFNDSVMKERLPKETYKAMQKTIQNGEDLNLEVANVVAIGLLRKVLHIILTGSNR